jgi:hypothetical protein
MGQVNPLRHVPAAGGRSPAAPLYPHGFRGEPTLSDLLRDPIAEALMVADHVGRPDLDVLLATARCNLHSRGVHSAAL